jgi:hypothetical protein
VKNILGVWIIFILPLDQWLYGWVMTILSYLNSLWNEVTCKQIMKPLIIFYFPIPKIIYHRLCFITYCLGEILFLLLCYWHIVIVHIYMVQCDISAHVNSAQWWDEDAWHIYRFKTFVTFLCWERLKSLLLAILKYSINFVYHSYPAVPYRTLKVISLIQLHSFNPIAFQILLYVPLPNPLLGSNNYDESYILVQLVLLKFHAM